MSDGPFTLEHVLNWVPLRVQGQILVGLGERGEANENQKSLRPRLLKALGLTPKDLLSPLIDALREIDRQGLIAIGQAEGIEFPHSPHAYARSDLVALAFWTLNRAPRPRISPRQSAGSEAASGSGGMLTSAGCVPPPAEENQSPVMRS